MNWKCLLLDHDYYCQSEQINDPSFSNVSKYMFGLLLCLTGFGYPIGIRIIRKFYYCRDGICRRCEKTIFQITDRNRQYVINRMQEEKLAAKLRERFRFYSQLRDKAL